MEGRSFLLRYPRLQLRLHQVFNDTVNPPPNGTSIPFPEGHEEVDDRAYDGFYRRERLEPAQQPDDVKYEIDIADRDLCDVHPYKEAICLLELGIYNVESAGQAALVFWFANPVSRDHVF